MRVLALDLGSTRVGVAISDPTGMIGQSLTVISRRSWDQVIGEVATLIRAHRVDRVVVGLPLHLDGREGDGAAQARRFADRLRGAAHVPVVLEDERLSTAEAERVMLEADVRRSVRRARRDAVAAALILQRHLDRGRASGQAGGKETTGGNVP